MKTLSALVLFLGCLAAPAVAQTTPTTAPTDLLGTWNVSVTTSQGQVIPSQLRLKKEGDQIVGTIASHMGEAPVHAEVKGKMLTVWFSFQGQSGLVAVELTGTADGETVKGTMAVAGQPGGEWTGTRDRKESKDLAKDSKDLSKDSNEQRTATTDLGGSWGVTVELPNMTASPTLVLKQDGEKLTGDYVSAQYGRFPITGTIKGADVSFWFAMNVEGNALNVTYTGTVDKDGTLKGSVNYGDMMAGTFTASKKK